MFPDKLSNATRSASGVARALADALRQDADAASCEQRAWDELDSFVHRGWPVHVLDVLEREAATFEKTLAREPPLGDLIREIRELAEQESRTVMQRFPTLMDQACTQAGIPPDRTSRHPKYSFEQGFFEVQIDDGRRQARLDDYEGRLAEFPADVGAVVERVGAEKERVFGRSFDGQTFLKSVRHQYLQVLRKSRGNDGDTVPVRQITRRLGKNVKGFRSDEFIVDLSRLVHHGPVEIDGRRLDLQQTKDTSQGVLLHDVPSHGYVGFIVFRKE